MGFCRTNLFKRLESSGQAFVQSIQRHILRNFVYLHALENDQPLPIGTQDASLLDARITDADRDLFAPEEDEDNNHQEPDVLRLYAEADFRRRAAGLCPVRRTAQEALPLAPCRPLSTATRQGSLAPIAPPCWLAVLQVKLKTLCLITHEHQGKKACHRLMPCLKTLVGARLAAVTGTDDAARFSL